LISKPEVQRKDFELILDLDSIGGRGVFLKRQAFRDIREKIDPESKRILFKNARISPRKHRRKTT
jgi:hypothetical protein